MENSKKWPVGISETKVREFVEKQKLFWKHLEDLEKYAQTSETNREKESILFTLGKLDEYVQEEFAEGSEQKEEMVNRLKSLRGNLEKLYS